MARDFPLRLALQLALQREDSRHDDLLAYLEALDELDEVKLCVRYRLPDGTETDRFIPDAHRLESVVPVYETLPGWREDVREAPDRRSLPANAQRYLARIEEIVGVPIEVVSLGPERSQTLVDGRRTQTTVAV